MNGSEENNRCRLQVNFAQSEFDPARLAGETLAAARAAQRRWVRTPLRCRLSVIRELRVRIAEHALRLARASAAARGRPAAEVLSAEVLPLAEACRFLEREAERILAPHRLGRRGRPFWLGGIRSEIHREPFGVVLIIGPGNYPLLLPGVQVIQSLVAGNAVLLKPGAGGSVAARALIALLQRAGLDSGLVTVLPESVAAARSAIAAGPDKVLFTGSAENGESILNQLAPRLIPATLELSGFDSVLVRADADLELVVKALLFGLRLNGGETCIAPRRVLVASRIASDFKNRLSQGWGMAHARNGSARNGANRSLSGNDNGQGKPEETLPAPLRIVTVTDDEEAVMRANDCAYALGASIFTNDEAAARILASRLNAGVVSINDLIVPTADPRIPFGGRARSGFGVTRGAEGLLELTVSKVVTVSRGKFRPALDQVGPGDEQLFTSYLVLAHGRGWKRRLDALRRLFRQLYSRRNQLNAHETNRQ